MQNDNAKFKKEFIQRLIRFSLEVMKLCSAIRLDKDFWAISDQLIRSATSVGANVIEAKSCGSKKDYIRFFEIALRSANETKYWLILVKESNQKFNSKAETLLQEASEIANILGAGIITMKGKRSSLNFRL